MPTGVGTWLSLAGAGLDGGKDASASSVSEGHRTRGIRGDVVALAQREKRGDGGFRFQR